MSALQALRSAISSDEFCESRKRCEVEFWGLVDIKDPLLCWDWLGSKNLAGYGTVSADHARHLGEKFSHRIALALFELHHEGRPNALHSCDRPICCNPRHLRWGTADDNCNDRGIAAWMRAATSARAAGLPIPRHNDNIPKFGPGSRNPFSATNPHPAAKHDAQTVLAMRMAFDCGEHPMSIAARHDATPACVSAIGTRRTWRYL